MIGLIFGDTNFPNEILKKIKKKKNRLFDNRFIKIKEI
jgi:hypothetical protein